MAISFSCPQCGKGYKVKDELAGKTVPCKECAEPIRIPPAILEAQAAFERDLPQLLKERPGQWVAYRPEGPVVFAPTNTVVVLVRVMLAGIWLESTCTKLTLLMCPGEP